MCDDTEQTEVADDDDASLFFRDEVWKNECLIMCIAYIEQLAMNSLTSCI